MRADRIAKILNHSDVIFFDRTDLAVKAGFPPRMAALHQKAAISGDCRFDSAVTFSISVQSIEKADGPSWAPRAALAGLAAPDIIIARGTVLSGVIAVGRN